LEAAIAEFASRGFDGARVDAIARQTNTARAMIYYYFKSKEGLYLAVLEDAYVSIRKAEQSLDLAHLSPEQAIGELVGFTFDYYQRHPEFVALVVAENQAGGPLYTQDAQDETSKCKRRWCHRRSTRSGLA
jgi:AcrR family transcriptional regulator